MTTKAFPTSAVLSVLTGVLLGKIDGVYEVTAFMAGEGVYTHQLPRVSREAVPVILAMHPQLEPVIAEAEQVTRENWQQWLSTWADRYGDEIAVPVMNISEHERIDPLSELAEKVHPSKIITVSTGTGGTPNGEQQHG